MLKCIQDVTIKKKNKYEYLIEEHPIKQIN